METPVDVVLDRLARLHGRLFDRETGDRLTGSVKLFDPQGELVAGTATDFPEGTWSFDLAPGTYRLLAAPRFYEPHIPQLYDNRVCAFDFYFELVCDVASGDPISLDSGEERQIDSPLDLGGELLLRLVQPAGYPVWPGGIDVTWRWADGTLLDGYNTAALASVFGPIADAPYRFSLESPDGLYPPQHYPGVLCSDPDCSQPEGGTYQGELSVEQETDWQLIGNGLLSGEVRDLETGEQTDQAELGLYDESGELVRRLTYGSFPYYVPSPTPGRYRIAAVAPGYFAHVLGDGDCTGQRLDSCDGTSGTVFELTYDQIVDGVDFDLTPGCPVEALCTNDGRFEVRATWRDPAGVSGDGTAVQLTDQTGTFWFFDRDNVELVVKVLDACYEPFDRFWVFAAGLTDVEVELEILDLESGVTRTYSNELGQPFQPITDTDAFDTCHLGDSNVGDSHVGTGAEAAPLTSLATLTRSPTTKSLAPVPAGPLPRPVSGPPNDCTTEPEGTCLGSRFRVHVEWDTGEQSGVGVPASLTDDSSYFYFFSPENVEVLIKVLDACYPPFDRFWVFAGGLTDVGVTLTVTDTYTGQTNVYTHDRGAPFQPVIDTDAFATCY